MNTDEKSKSYNNEDFKTELKNFIDVLNKELNEEFTCNLSDPMDYDIVNEHKNSDNKIIPREIKVKYTIKHLVPEIIGLTKNDIYFDSASNEKPNSGEFDPIKNKCTLIDLIPEITGIPKEHLDFELNYKKIQRLLIGLRGILGKPQMKSSVKVTNSSKSAIVDILKDIYNLPNSKEIRLKLEKRQELTTDEEKIIIAILYNASYKNESEEVKSMAFAKYKEAKGIKYNSKKRKIKKMVESDLGLINNINLNTQKLEFMDEYMAILESSLKEIRKTVKEYISSENSSKSKNIIKKILQIDQISSISSIYDYINKIPKDNHTEETSIIEHMEE